MYYLQEVSSTVFLKMYYFSSNTLFFTGSDFPASFFYVQLDKQYCLFFPAFF